MSKTLKEKWIVITRPAHQAESFKRKLESVGAKAILFPLIEIAPPNDLTRVKEQLKGLHEYDLVIFVSANAVEHTFKYIDPELLSSVTVATTGKKTALALESYHVKTTFSPTKVFNSEALLAVPNFAFFVEGKNVAIIRGEDGRDLLRDELLKVASHVDYIDTYQRLCPQNNLQVLESHAKLATLDVILLTSGTSVTNFFNLVDSKDQAWLKNITLLLGSPRMQKKIPSSFQGTLAIAEDPSDETLYKKLKEIC